jgi:hypothetical protein
MDKGDYIKIRTYFHLSSEFLLTFRGSVNPNMIWGEMKSAINLVDIAL